MTLENRLANLERRCRFLTGALATAAVTGVLAVLAGAASNNDDGPTELRATKLTIVDDEGDERILLGNVIRGRYGAAFLGDDHAERVAITVVQDMGVVEVYARDGRARLTARPGGGVVALSGGRGQRPVAKLQAGAEGEATLELLNSEWEKTVVPATAKLPRNPFGG